MENVTFAACAGQASLHEVLAHQVLAKMISKFADQLHKAEKCVCFRMHSSICVRVCCKLIIDRCIYLIHALHILDPRVQLGVDEQCSLDFLNSKLDYMPFCYRERANICQVVSTQYPHQCVAYLPMLLR